MNNNESEILENQKLANTDRGQKKRIWVIHLSMQPKGCSLLTIKHHKQNKLSGAKLLAMQTNSPDN
jgi:hypothetical protein